MDGFKRPRNQQRPRRDLPNTPPIRPEVQPSLKKRPIELPKPEELVLDDGRLLASKKSHRFQPSKLVTMIAAGVFVLVLGLVATYSHLLSPRNPSAKDTISVEIVSGMMPGQIAAELEESGVIRSRLAFTIHTRLRGTQNKLQAGSYQLSPASTTPEIVISLQGGPGVDEIEVMFKPGATLADNKEVLMDLGYSSDEIDKAFTASYDHPLFQGRPGGSDIEGYIFGETHRFVRGSTVKEILRQYFDDYYAIIKKNNLVEGYAGQNLSLYEGIILASIIHREVRSEADQKQVAQVFYSRLSLGMPLGADATFEYAAKKTGETPSPSLESPYNTRKYAGLPPGPIASPGVSALIAAANPAEGDYLYFVSGDDGVNHFSRTIEEHEAKTRRYCTTLCFGG